MVYHNNIIYNTAMYVHYKYEQCIAYFVALQLHGYLAPPPPVHKQHFQM